MTSDERDELRRLRAENKRLREVNDILNRRQFLRGRTRPPKPLIVAFTDQMRAAGHAVESIVIALNTAGLKIAARTLRAWCAPAGPGKRPAARTVTDALMQDAIRTLAFTTNAAGQRVLTPEGFYGRRKMLALIRRSDDDAAARTASQDAHLGSRQIALRARPVRARDGHESVLRRPPLALAAADE